jgi:hypothetical protein
MVAPSFEMVTLRPSNTSLSIPRGPRVVFTASATAWQALMFEISWGLPGGVGFFKFRGGAGGRCVRVSDGGGVEGQLWVGRMVM